MKKNYQVKLTLLVSMFLIILAFVSCSKNDVDSEPIIDENYLNLDYSDFGKGVGVKGEQELSVNEMSEDKFKIVLEGVDRFEENVKQENGIYDLNSIDKEMLNISPALYDYCLYLFSILNSQSLQEMIVPDNSFASETRGVKELYIDLEFCYELCYVRYKNNAEGLAGVLVSFLSSVLKIDRRLSFALAVARGLIYNSKVQEAIGARRIVVTLKYRYSSSLGVELLELMVHKVDSTPHKKSPCSCSPLP